LSDFARLCRSAARKGMKVNSAKNQNKLAMDSNLEDQFNSLAIEFLFVCENVTELNNLLSSMNGLDYKKQQISKTKSIVDFIDSLPKIPPSAEANVIVKACCLVKQLITKQKIVLPEQVSSKVINWILKCCNQKTLNMFFCEATDVMTILFKTNAAAAQQVNSIKININKSKINFLK
jgi:hypothetical protein